MKQCRIGLMSIETSEIEKKRKLFWSDSPNARDESANPLRVYRPKLIDPQARRWFWLSLGLVESEVQSR